MHVVWSVSKCLFFHQRKIDSFNSMTSVFGNRITLVAFVPHTHTHTHVHTCKHSHVIQGFHLWCEWGPFYSNHSHHRSMLQFIYIFFVAVQIHLYRIVLHRWHSMKSIFDLNVCARCAVCVRHLSMTLPAVAAFTSFSLLLSLFRSRFTSAFFLLAKFPLVLVNANKWWNSICIFCCFAVVCEPVCAYMSDWVSECRCFAMRVCMRMIDRAKRNLGFIVKQ